MEGEEARHIFAHKECGKIEPMIFLDNDIKGLIERLHARTAKVFRFVC
ncbi:hypothetical protein [Burkholderia sp. S171]|jgi:hypothetical protein|nr:hypothetical protein [Burkholderia sp. S171]